MTRTPVMKRHIQWKANIYAFILYQLGNSEFGFRNVIVIVKEIRVNQSLS